MLGVVEAAVDDGARLRVGLLDLARVLELAEHVPRRRDGDEEDAKVEADRDKVVDVGLGLHRPGDRLAEGLDAAEDARVAREVREVGRVLADEPVEELLEGLASKGPEEDEGVGPAKLRRCPVEQGLVVVVLLLEDDGPDPGADEDRRDRGLRAGLVDSSSAWERSKGQSGRSGGRTKATLARVLMLIDCLSTK
jgi:hypothetical protein